MDGLEHYKKAWGNQPQEKHQISAVEIHKISQSKSSSIVKWIFVIGLFEFIFMIGSNFMIDTSKQEKMMEELGVHTIVQFSQYLTLPVMLYFLYLFYRNYQNISITENTHKLMGQIIKTRKTVQNYVIFNLLYIVFISFTMTVAMVVDPQGGYQNAPGWFVIVVMLVVTAIMLLLFWLFYQLLYGILLNKLHRNYKEMEYLNK
ncbi:hypothetical protein [Polaribacter sp. HL-MS24]|uniref:hypothetical protein n=1 Tax=Polaribacter sp. HL-MS24 TaxID=3077735 RepID=UPI00293526FA|nr:hypothetical protein [Polaribacter sp. HL-MS24]WOC40401.1 hypothetical protein RRF69_00895 [Polaribacter sp. HL-MS24]